MGLFRCGMCGYIHDGDDAPDKCPRCGAPKEQFARLTDEQEKLVERSRTSNEMHVAMMSLYQKLAKWARVVKEDQLDPNCVKIADRVLKDSHETIQSIKAELESHMKKGKWG